MVSDTSSDSYYNFARQTLCSVDAETPTAPITMLLGIPLPKCPFNQQLFPVVSGLLTLVIPAGEASIPRLRVSVAKFSPCHSVSRHHPSLSRGFPFGGAKLSGKIVFDSALMRIGRVYRSATYQWTLDELVQGRYD